MFLVFYPKAPLEVMFIFFYYYRSFRIQAYWMILLWLFVDLLGVVLGGGRIGHLAHLGGFGAGVLMAWLLLATGWTKMAHYEESLLQITGIHENPFAADRPFEDDMQRLRESAAGSRGGGRQQGARPANTSRGGPDIGKDGVFISFRCPCGNEISTLRRNVGQQRKCPACGRTVRVP